MEVIVHVLLFAIRIVSEDSKVRSGRSLLSTSSFNRTSITLEFGNPPAPNITLVPPPSVAEEITTAREINDSVDLTVNFVATHLKILASTYLMSRRLNVL